MFRRVLVLLITLSLGVTGCGYTKNIGSSNSTLSTKFEVAADTQNDPVSGITPGIQEALIQAYLSQAGATREKFVKVVNSIPVDGGIEFVVRTKNGFSVFFMDNLSKKISFISGSASTDVSHNPMNCSIGTINADSSIKVFVGFFNLAAAKNALLTWSDGTTSLYQLTNGTLMISPFDGKTSVMKYEVKDEAGNTLYKE